MSDIAHGIIVMTVFILGLAAFQEVHATMSKLHNAHTEWLSDRELYIRSLEQLVERLKYLDEMRTK